MTEERNDLLAPYGNNIHDGGGGDGGGKGDGRGRAAGKYFICALLSMYLRGGSGSGVGSNLE